MCVCVCMCARVYFHLQNRLKLILTKTVTNVTMFAITFSREAYVSSPVLFCCSGRIHRLSLIRYSFYVEWLRNIIPDHSQGNDTERWSRNTLRVITARVFLTSPFILNSSVEAVAPFNVISHPRCCELRN